MSYALPEICLKRWLTTAVFCSVIRLRLYKCQSGTSKIQEPEKKDGRGGNQCKAYISSQTVRLVSIFWKWIRLPENGKKLF